MLREGVLPRVATRVSRGHVSAFRPIGGDDRIIVIKGLYHPFLATRSRRFVRGLVPRDFPIVFQGDRVVHVRVANYSARLDEGEDHFRRLRLLFRAMGGRRRFFSWANEEDQLPVYLNRRKGVHPIFNVFLRRISRFLRAKGVRFIRYVLSER